MTSKYGPLGIRVDDRYRTLPEARIIEMLLFMGWAYEFESGVAEKAAREALQAWTQMGLGFRCATNGERLFDLVEVHNFMKRAGVDERDNFWSRRFVPTCRRMVSDLAEAGPSADWAEGERRFVIELRRTFNLRAIPAGSRLRLRVPLPLTGDYLQDLHVTPFAETAREVQIKISPGRLEARMIVSGEAETILGATLSFTARLQKPGPGRGHGDPEPALYLCNREGFIVVSERIRALARSLAGVGATPLEAVRAFWEYIHAGLICGALHYDQIDLASPCDWVLDSGWFDCQMASALFVALCRAQGIPSRVLGGYLLYQVSPTNHYWAEVWIKDQGWTPFDFLGWDLSRGGRDPVWRDRFFGQLDYRMTCERMPREFTGALGVPIPQAWSLLQVPRPGGVEISFLDVNGTPVYADTVRVTDFPQA